MAWQEAARRSLVGDKVELRSVGGELWIRPKKLSQAAVDAVKDLRGKSLSGPGGKDVTKRALKIREKYKGALADQPLDQVPEEDLAEIIDLYSVIRSGPQREIYRAELQHGIGEHNFVDDAGKPIGGGRTLDAKTIDEVLEWSDLAVEIVNAIEAYNRPLGTATGGTSQTSPSGSTPAPSSGPEPESSPTVATP